MATQLYEPEIAAHLRQQQMIARQRMKRQVWGSIKIMALLSFVLSTSALISIGLLHLCLPLLAIPLIPILPLLLLITVPCAMMTAFMLGSRLLKYKIGLSSPVKPLSAPLFPQQNMSGLIQKRDAEKNKMATEKNFSDLKILSYTGKLL